MKSREEGPGDPGAGLRLLTACPECRIQYDVSKLQAGTKFRCSCGLSLQVPEPSAQESKVVRCSACGGPRQGDAPACSYCGATFTLHELDLQTVCPGCLARISNRARFCHHCGILIAPIALKGIRSRFSCPVCGKLRLHSRSLGQLTILECWTCAGIWLGHEVFRALQEQAREREAPVVNPFEAESPVTRNYQDVRYLRCVSCSSLMNRKVFDRSGVILDICAAHGIWFDCGELDRILRWIRKGGKARSEKLEESKRSEKTRLNGWALKNHVSVRNAETEFDELRGNRENFLEQIWRFLSAHQF